MIQRKKLYRFIYIIGCSIIKLILESYDMNIMQSRDKDRHKWLRETSANIIMDEINEEGINKRVYLLDEKFRKIVLKIGDKITNKEKEEIKLYEKNQLVAGLKEITALFEETDGLQINLQGRDRQKRIEKKINNKQK